MKTILGFRAKDVITGYQGTITGKAEYLTGCTQYCIVPNVGEDGTIRAGEWFDETRIQLMSDHPITLEKDGRIARYEEPKPVFVETGGPNRDAPR